MDSRQEVAGLPEKGLAKATGICVGPQNSVNKQGLPDEKLGWFFFPEVKGGKGKANDIFASLDGRLVSKEAPKETVDFMNVWLSKDVQRDLAAFH